MCHPVQHVLDAVASMASSATFRGILLRAVSGCCYNNGGLRNRRWANAITKHGGKGEWQTSVQSLPKRGLATAGSIGEIYGVGTKIMSATTVFAVAPVAGIPAIPVRSCLSLIEDTS